MLRASRIEDSVRTLRAVPIAGTVPTLVRLGWLGSLRMVGRVATQRTI